MQSEDGSSLHAEGAARTAAKIGFAAGIALFLLILLTPPPSTLSPVGWRTAAVAALMAVWWITEAIPIPVTALLPLVLFPLLGVAPIAKAAPPYANSVIFLFLGGFILAAALERSQLHRRIALNVMGAVGTKPTNLVGGFMITTAALSMWVSNTATVLMMLPIALSVLSVMGADAARIRTPLLLGVAYSASIGGLGTLIGTPPNALLAGFAAETLQRRIGFVEWMAVGVPLVVVATPVTWLFLTRVMFPLDNTINGETEAVLDRERAALGRMTRSEWITAIVCTATALAWVVQPVLEKIASSISDATIAIAGGLLLFLVPLDARSWRFVLSWNDVERLPWGVLILFGGGLSLAAAIETSGLAKWTGSMLQGLQGISPLLLTTIVATIVIFLTELTSNTATAATFLPLVSSLATASGIDPLLLAIAVALAASCGFMLPVGTPPNALVYADGHLTIGEMARCGIWVNLLMVALIQAAIFLVAVPLFGLR